MATAVKNSGVKILLADDSVTMHRAVTLGLRSEPFEVITCDNGQDALRLALEHHPQIVLADLDMPGLTGVELCQAIRAEKSLASTRVVLLCGSFDQVDEARLNSVEADGRLWKPFESHTLVALVQTLLKANPAKAAPTKELKLSGDGGHSDFARDMTMETFEEATNSSTNLSMNAPELPAPTQGQKAAGKKSPQQKAPREIGALPTLENISVNLVDETSELPQISESEATQNLWSPEFEPEASGEESNEPAFGSDGPVEVGDDFEIVTNQMTAELPLPERVAEIEETIIERLGVQAPDAPVDAAPSEWSADTDFASFREPTSPGTPPTPGTPPPPRIRSELNEIQIRALIREEITEAVRGWLKKDLETQLAQVIAEIDRD